MQITFQEIPVQATADLSLQITFALNVGCWTLTPVRLGTFDGFLKRQEGWLSPV